MPNETSTAKNEAEKIDERPFSEKHPNLLRAAAMTGHYLTITAVMVVSTLIVVEIIKRYGNVQNEGTMSSMDKF